MCFAITFFPLDDIKNFEINLSLLIKSSYQKQKSLDKKLIILIAGKALKVK